MNALTIFGAALLVIGLALIPVAVKHGWRLPGPTALAIPLMLAMLGAWCIQASIQK
ncbi:hypothetical protein ACWKWA_15370 [Dermacoccus abyssi]